MSLNTCPLCQSNEIHFFHSDEHGTHYRCGVCDLISTDPAELPSPKTELERYDTHENNPDDPGYRQFLGHLFEPMNELLPTSSFGLDFGSGPGPTLNIMFEEQGHTMNIYDPFYADDTSVFDKQYDFITSTETFEHLHYPRKEIDLLWNCLKSGGYLGIMTKQARDKKHFKDWHYKKDDTHVTFFSKDTFRWLEDHWNAKLSFYDHYVVIFQKPKYS